MRAYVHEYQCLQQLFHKYNKVKRMQMSIKSKMDKQPWHSPTTGCYTGGKQNQTKNNDAYNMKMKRK